ncbi:hypothetical protein TIFTF001_015346 [Ficus carica]|uniref:Uncharacterized protein n=1 Tax=Ficus carica TaxID=3494 RepID=A0AA88AHM3_FICCA|nr:hypothetical protein TIFTF001_015346 [Ficus carica]
MGQKLNSGVNEEEDAGCAQPESASVPCITTVGRTSSLRRCSKRCVGIKPRGCQLPTVNQVQVTV